MAAKKTAKKAAKKAAKAPATPAAGKPGKPAAGKTAKAAPKPRPSTDEIAKAAYLNYRRRIENDLPGSHESDWLEAERQLSEGK